MIQEFEIQTNAKLSVYTTQGNFCKQDLLIVCYSTLIAFNVQQVMLWLSLKEEVCFTLFRYLSFMLSFGLPQLKRIYSAFNTIRITLFISNTVNIPSKMSFQSEDLTNK